MAIIAVGLGASGCLDSKSTVLGEEGSIQVTPESVTFAAPLLRPDGGTERAVRALLLSNVGAGVLSVASIEMREDDGDGELGVSFEMPGPDDVLVAEAAQVTAADLCPDPNDGHFKLEAEGRIGSRCVVLVTFDAQDAAPDRAQVSIRTDDVGDANRLVEVETLASGPRLAVDPPGELLFEREVEGAPGVVIEPDQQLIRLTNVGTDSLEIDEIKLVNNAGGDFVFGVADDSPIQSLPATLAPQDFRQRIDLVVSYAPTRPGIDRGELRIRSNDAVRPELIIPLSARALAKCVFVSPLDVDFRQVRIGESESLTVDISNCGTVDAAVPKIGFVAGSHESFQIEQVPQGLSEGCLGEAGARGAADCEGEMFIAPGDSRSLSLRYAPVDEGAAGGKLGIHTDSPGQELITVNLFGRGLTDLPPRAVVEGRPSGAPEWNMHTDEDSSLEVFPTTTVELRGDQSTDPEGGRLTYKWSIVQMPEGAVTRFMRSDSIPNPTIFIPVSGLYIFELQVTDPTGQVDTERIYIFAVSHGCVHVELTWNTPGDPDQIDEGFGAGSDVDLHLLHPLGDWGDPVRDCHFRNPNPDWGNAFDGTDDPSLDIDDTDGAGPENITLDQCENNRIYRVGVHYFNDHGYGPSFATVSVYVDGVLRAQFANKRLGRTDDFWDVATVTSGGAITPIDDMFIWP